MSLELDLLLEPVSEVLELTVEVPLPLDELETLDVNALRFSPEPLRLREENGQRYAVFHFSRLNEPRCVRLELDARFYALQLEGLQRRARRGHVPRPLPASDRERFLAPEPGVESTSPRIVRLAAEIEGVDRIERLSSALQLVVDALDYVGPGNDDLGAERTLAAGGGDCLEFSDVLAAILRADGIPARVVSGTHFPGLEGAVLHVWVQAWSEEYGWVAVDPAAVESGHDGFGTTIGFYLPQRSVRRGDEDGPWLYRWRALHGEFSVAVSGKVRPR